MKNLSKKSFRLNPISHIVLLTLSSSLPIFAAANTTTVNTDKTNFQPLFTIEAPKKWMPRVSITGEYGNYGVGQADLFTPFYSNNRTLLFFDLRATATAHSTQEYNGALGFRSIIGDTTQGIVGAHIWDDRKHTQYGNFFDQATLGGEYFGNIYSITSNIYVPYGEKKQLAYGSSAGATPFVTGHTVGYFADGAYETALKGIDVEVGKQDLINRHLRVYADYYHFGEGSDSVRLNGGRARSEFIIENKWLHNMGSDVMLTASVQYDNVQHAAGFFGLRLNVGRDYEPTDPLVGRLEEYIIRDNNIVTPIGEKASIRVTDPETFIFVDNTQPAGGDGTKEHPFNTEQAAVASAKSGNIIYTFQGSGNYSLPSGGLNLIQNVVFFGSGSDFLFNNVVVLPSTSAPVLNGRINVASNDTINGFTISGLGSSENIGISGNNVSNVSIINTTVQDFQGDDANGASGSTYGGNAGIGGSVYGIQITNSNNILLDQVTVKDIVGGDANGGAGTERGGFGGTGGTARGIDLTGGSSLVLSNITIQNITGGDAKGGSATNPYASFSLLGDGGTAGTASGIMIYNGTSLNLSNVTISNISGGSGDSGVQTNTLFYSPFINGGRLGVGGNAIGIDLTSSSAITLSNISLSNVTGGSANNGDINATNATPGSYIYTNSAGTAGNAKGIDLTGASSIALSNISISGLSGGSANGGDANAGGAMYAQAGVGGIGGSATGIDLTSASSFSLSNISISNLTGGSANGGNCNTYSDFSQGGNGGTGGNAIGIKGVSSLPASVTVTNLTGGSATGGDATSTTGLTFQGADGTNGTASPYQP